LVYAVYCGIGLLVWFLLPFRADGSPFSHGEKEFLVVLASRLWPYPMLASLGWRVHAESVTAWILADLAGLVFVALLTLAAEWIAGPERRGEKRVLIGTLIGLGVALLVLEFAVVAAIRLTDPS